MAPSGSRTLRSREGRRGGHAPPRFSAPPTSLVAPKSCSNYKSSIAGGYVPRVAHLLVAAKRREFRLELTESRRIVPEWTSAEWTSARTGGRRRGSRGVSNWSTPQGILLRLLTNGTIRVEDIEIARGA